MVEGTEHMQEQSKVETMRAGHIIAKSETKSKVHLEQDASENNVEKGSDQRQEVKGNGQKKKDRLSEPKNIRNPTKETNKMKSEAKTREILKKKHRIS